jgi:hypothetical protein
MLLQLRSRHLTSLLEAHANGGCCKKTGTPIERLGRAVSKRTEHKKPASSDAREE